MGCSFCFLVIFAIIISVGLYCFRAIKAINNITNSSIQVIMNQLKGKKIVMITAFRDFRDAEYFVPKEIFEAAGSEVKTASTQMGIAIGADGGEVEVDFLVSEIMTEDFDAVAFVGGPGALQYLDNEDSYNLARKIFEENKILGAICIAPVILAKSGVLENKRATVWSSPMDKRAVKKLKENGVIYQENPVVIDGKIITADGPQSARAFGEAVTEVLIK